jgi:hypothetical protein
MQMQHYSSMVAHLKKVAGMEHAPSINEYGWDDQDHETKEGKQEDKSVIAKNILQLFSSF